MEPKKILEMINQVEDKADKTQLKIELSNIFEGMKQVSEGFFKIAQSANKMKDKKLYLHLGFDTFDVFCKQIIGLTRKQVSLYIRIAEISEEYNDIFNEKFVLSIGPTKMDIVARSINQISDMKISKSKKIILIEDLADKISPELTVAETEILVKNYMQNIEKK